MTVKKLHRTSDVCFVALNLNAIFFHKNYLYWKAYTSAKLSENLILT